MTTEQIRKNVIVMGFSISQIGIYITYTYKLADFTNDERTLALDPLPSIIELERIGSIRKFDTNPLVVYWDSPKGAACHGSWELFHPWFVLSQYEAISLVVRREYEQSLKSDMNLLEIDKTLEALKH